MTASEKSLSEQRSHAASTRKRWEAALVAAAIVWVAFRIPMRTPDNAALSRHGAAVDQPADQRTAKQPDGLLPEIGEARLGVGTGRETTPPQAKKEQQMLPQSTRIGAVEHASEADFATKVLQSSEPVLVDFYADWCGPCRMLAPVLEDAARELASARIVKVNVDENPALASRYAVRAIPTLLVFRNGEATAKHVGMASKDQIKQFLQ